MDKKANLTPELKEIYDRVMNTSGAPKAPSAPESQTTGAPAAPAPAAPPTTTPAAASAAAPTAGTPPPAAPSEDAIQKSPLGTSMVPQEADTPPDTAENALTSSPPRPISQIGEKPFTFSGTAPKADTATGEKAQGKKSGLPIPLMIGFGVILVAVWLVFWLIFLGFIKR